MVGIFAGLCQIMIASEVIIFLYNNEGFQLQMNLVQSYYETNIRREIGRRPVYVGIIFPGPMGDQCDSYVALSACNVYSIF